MLSRALTWLDASPARYFSVAWLAFGIVIVLAAANFFPHRARAGWRHPVVFGAAVLLCLFAFRWPVLADNRQLPDPDESQLIAGALTLRHDPVFWRSVDGTTHGPLADWPLVAASVAGFRLDYTTARSVSALLACLASLSAWLVFRRLFGVELAGLLVLPLLAVDAFTQAWPFVAYCSEHAPAALIAVGCAALLLARDREGRNASRAGLFAAGVALGAAPFAKLQSAPIAAVALAGGAVLALTQASAWRERLRAVAALAAGAIVMPTLILGMVGAAGIWTDFWQCFVVNNVAYANERWFTWAETPAKLLELVDLGEGFARYFRWLVPLVALGLLLLPRCTTWHRRIAIFSAAVLVAAVYATVAPGRMFPHYLQLTTFPLALCAGTLAGAAVSALATRAGKRRWLRIAHAAVLLAFLGVGLVPQVCWRAHEGQPYLGKFTRTHGALAQSAAAREILLHARPGEAMAIWGWMPAFWVQTGLIQGTRDGNGSRQIDPIRDRDYYRARFLRDMQRTRPSIFVDAVGEGENFGYHDRAALAHETFPALRDCVAADYRLAADVEGTRIYVRADRP